MPIQGTTGRRGLFAAQVICILLTAWIALSISGFSQTSTIGNPAYQEINQRSAANSQSFYVYLDQDSGFNHGFPSGFMGTDQGTISLNAGCIDDANSPTGCFSLSDTTALDRVHGTVLSVSFGAQTPGNWDGLALEEPQGWLGEHYGVGYDLTGATSLTFSIRSPNGARVQFGVGESGGAGCVTGFTQPIASTWKTVTIALNSSDLSCTPDLTNMHLLFEVITSDAYAPRGATVLLDNIQFSPVPTAQKSALGFPVSNQTFGVVPQQAKPIPVDQVMRNVSTIYESALAEIALLFRGNQQDVKNAKLIADTFDYALHHESHGDPIPAAPGGYTGLHNGYEDGAIALYNSQPTPLLGQAGDVRLAGFTDATLCPPSGYCLVLDGATGGNNAFAIIALVDAFRQFGDVKYLNDALTIGNWIVGNLTDKSGTGYGGYYVGYGDEGIKPPKPLETGKSTENNADIFAAFTALANVESELGKASAATSWTTAANIAGDFVMRMYDSENGRFNVGTSPAGSAAGLGNCPTGPQKGEEVINVCDFIDSNTFVTLAMATAPRYRNQIDWRVPIEYALNTFAETVTAGGRTYDGFDIVSTPDSGANGIAWEFTGQQVAAMSYSEWPYGEPYGFESAVNMYLGQIAQAQKDAPFADGLGLVAATQQGGDTLAPMSQCLDTPYQCVQERVGLAATAWAILAEQRWDVYAPVAVPTTTTIARSPNAPNPSIYGQALTFTATVKAPFGLIPNGSVIFGLAASECPAVINPGCPVVYVPVVLRNGTGSLTTPLSVGSNSINASFGYPEPFFDLLDTGFGGSSSATLKQTVQKATTTTALAARPNPSIFGQAVTLTVTVMGQYGGAPTGTVTFYDGKTKLGTATPSKGSASLTTSGLTVGTHSITAVYEGDWDFIGSTSKAVGQVVTKATTTTALSSSVNPSKSGQSVTFTATVKGQYGGAVTGSVAFSDGKTVLKTVALSGGTVKFSTSGLTSGQHSLTATYSGDANDGASMGSLTQKVN